MFVGKEFVIKHIRVKQSAAVDEAREKVSSRYRQKPNILCQILDEVYFENFKRDKEEQERRMAQEREQAFYYGTHITVQSSPSTEQQNIY